MGILIAVVDWLMENAIRWDKAGLTTVKFESINPYF
jgi:hypothetical protein